MSNRITIVLALVVSLFAAALSAQNDAVVSYADDFQSYGTQKNPPGWIDTSVGSSKPAAGGLYKTWPDPLQGNQGTNIVYGTKQSSGKPDGNNPRIGTFSTYTAKTFAGKGRFEYRGRFIRTNSDTRIGFTLFSSYPETDHYYLVGLWDAGAKLTMQIFSFGAGALTGTVDSNFTPEPNKWYRFAIQSDDVNGATLLRARFWLEGDKEPAAWTIDAKDSTAQRLTSGRFGLWSAVKGDAYIDDITAKSPVDHTPPVIKFIDLDTNKTLDPAVLQLFKVSARIKIDVTDDLSTVASVDAKLDGADYASGTPIADGQHTITVHAVDAPGNAADATLKLLVDTKPPVVSLFYNGAPALDGTIFAADVKLSATVTDTSTVTTTATLDGNAIQLPFTAAEEKVHSLSVTSVDQLGWSTTVTSTFILDKSKPVIKIYGNGQLLTDTTAFRDDVTLTWTVEDLTYDPTKVTATLDSNAVTSGTVLTQQGVHTISVTATDKAGHTNTLAYTFPFAKGNPAVTITANGQPFVAGSYFNVPVVFHFAITDPTPTTTVATVDGAAYQDGGTIGAETPRPHVLSLKVTNAAGGVTEFPSLPFTIDLHPPAVTLTESGTAFTNGLKFNRDVVPVLTATDDVTADPEKHLLVDGHEASLTAPIAQESADHTIEGTAKDQAGNTATTGVFHFVLDKTPPDVKLVLLDEAGQPLTRADMLFNKHVRLQVTVTDMTDAPAVATVNGAPFSLGSPTQSGRTFTYLSPVLTEDKVYDVAVSATDVAGNVGNAAAKFTIDTTPPNVAFTSPSAGAVVSAPEILVQGTSGDAVTVVVNGRDATIDAAAQTFAINDVELIEGTNEITAVGTDKAGNSREVKVTVSLDTRPPQLAVTPFAACTSATSLDVAGRAADDHLGTTVTLSLDPSGATATAPIAADGTWHATIATASEGKFVLTARTEDAGGHASVVTLPVTVDRTKPAIALNAGGAAFSGGTFRTAQSIDVRANDADPNVAVTATLNDAPYVSGTVIRDGSYTLKVEAHDCAGNSSSATVAFKIDSVPPVLVSITPAEGSKVSSLPQSVTGTVRDPDLKSVIIEGTSIGAAVSGNTFTFANAPLSEGANTLNLILADEAGNTTPVAYHVNVKTTTPGVTITERGLPIVALYNRPVTPVVSASEAGATLSATLDGAAYDPAGRVVDTNGQHTVTATATDGYGHTTNPAVSVTFTIDRQAPDVTIESPADQAAINAATTDVRGTANGGDIDHVTVNNLPATLAADGKFTATAVPLEVGENLITATATDRAGNTGTKQITVTRGTDQPGLVLTAPADRTYTNRPTTTVIGQLLTRGTGAKVTINDVEVPVDSAGTFRKDGQPLVEGWNDITAKILGTTRSVTVKVFADLTPPTLTILANGAPLEQGAHFATSPVITLQAADNNQDSLKTKLTIDGVVIAGASPVLGDGGHAVTGIATDIGGNAVRVDRTFSVGGSAGSGGGCTISALNPPDGSTVRDAALKLSGRAGGAANILVNGARAQMESGTFAAGVQLAAKANRITIACADANGNPTADPATTLTVYLYTTDPTITIDAPARGAALTSNTVTVTGHVGESVVSGDVNGIAFTPANGVFSVPNVSLANGMNVITARGRDGVGRAGIATVDVIVKTKAPSISITSPLPASTTGAATIDVSGLYANAEASSVHVGSSVVETKALTDTTGSFIARSVPIAAGTTTTITATAQNAAGQSATATVDVQNAAGPAISIALPADNTYFAAGAAAPSVSGTIAADPGSTVQVNGVDGAVSGSAFSAPGVPFATSGATNYIARVTTPDNRQAVDSVRVVKLGALAVTQTFPAANATGVDPGVAIVVLFSNPIDRNTTGGMTLADDAGNAVIGDKFVDNEAVTFAPQTPLVPGRHYTLTISTSLHDLGGNALASPYTLGFTTGTTAPAVKPLLNHGDVTNCITSDTLSGTASAAGVRVQLDLDGIATTTIAGNDRTFSFLISFAGQSGFHIARVREIGADGSFSPAETVCYRITCNGAGPHVVGASLDRGAKTLTVEFSTAMDAATLTASPTGTILLHPSGAPAFAGTVALNSAGTLATVAYTADLSASQTLTVTTGAKTPAGAAITEFTTTFDAADQTPTGKGYIAGAIYDADTGRAIEGASVVITPGPITRVTASNGHYATQSLAEGAYTIEATASGYTKVWRQVVVPAGVGVVPIDIRLTKRAPDQSGGADLTLKHGGANALTAAIEVAVPAAALTPGTPVAATSVGGQSLAGLLPLGWSPLAAAEIAVNHSAASPAASLSGAKLTFVIASDVAAAVTAANQTLSVVQYDSQRDEWRTLVAVAAIANGRVAADIVAAGNYALVYPDNTAVANLAHPAPARGGTALQGVPNPCTNSPADCRMTATKFEFNPPTVAPTEKSVATLVATAAGTYPSGTAVQAYIDEQLNFADGSVRNDAPFATDLLVYRNLSGSAGQAVFGLSPTTAAASGTLRDGADHVRVVDYPGRVDRGALIGAEGGRVPVDDTMSIDIPAGATNDSIHATATPMLKSAVDAFGTIPGFHAAGGFTLSMTRSTDTQVDIDGDGKPDVIPVQLLEAARGTFTITSFPTANQQVVIAEVIEKSAYGAPLLRLAATTTPSATAVAGARVFSTNDVDPTKLAVDGIVRDGRYLVLTADAPVAYAWGQVRVGAGGPLAAGAFVAAGNGSAFAPALGLTDVARTGGLFAIAVQAQPAGAFALRGRTVATGVGNPNVFSRAANADENVNFGDLVVTPLPPTSVVIDPSDRQISISGFHATATFDVDMDGSSADGALLVNNLTTGTALSGHVSTVGKVVTFTPAGSLAAGSKYSITVLPTIRSASGAPFGQTKVAYFTTDPPTPDNTHMDASLIHITIPVNGMSTVTGTAGALPVGDIALAVRRGKFFVRAPSVEVTNADGSFTLQIGNSVGDDVITMSDVIDLQVLDKVSRSPIAIIPLTPFVYPDGLGFVAPVGMAVTFKSKDGVTVRVPAGAFDAPTTVRVTTAAPSAFADVPSASTELSILASINVDFDGLANKPLDVDIPVPAGTTTSGHEFQLGRLGDSALGPRIEIDDLLRVDGSVFTTRDASTTGQLRMAATSKTAKPNEVLVGAPVRDYLLHMIKSGVFAVTDIHSGGSPLAWTFMDGLQANLDIFWSCFHSLYVSQLYLTAGHGRIVMPVISSQPFTVDGVDHDTGIKLFSSDYAGVPAGTPGVASGIPSLEQNSSGPYPVSGTPFEIQLVTVVAGLDTIKAPGLTVDTSIPGQAKVSFSTTAGPNDPPRHLSVLNTRTGDLKDDASSISTASQVGDTLVVMMSREPVEPRSDLSVVFNEPIQVDDTLPQADLDAVLQPLFQLQQKNGATNWNDVAATTFHVDSGKRRVLLHANLQAGLEYRLRLMKDIADTGSPQFKLAQVGSNPPANEIDLYFTVSKPKGNITGGDIKAGNVRDLALDGNLLLVSAQEGGILAYDASDAPNINTQQPFATAQAIPAGIGQSWSIFVDHHGRIWNTAVTSMFGTVRSYRTEKFADKLTNPTPPDNIVDFYGGGTVSWRNGATVGLDTGLETTILSDRPEATPRKMQIAVQDDAVQAIVDANFLANLGGAPVGATVTPNGPVANSEFNSYTVKVTTQGGTVQPTQSGFPYLTQRITVRNVTLGLRWSQDGDAGPKTGAGGKELTFKDVLARPGDTVRIERNEATYGVVALFGYGVGVYDLNAIESNSRFAQNPSNVYANVAYSRLGTLIGLTQGYPLPNGSPALNFCPDVVMTANATADPSGQTTATLSGFGLIPAKGMESVTASHGSGTLEANGEEGATPGSISDFTDPSQFPDLDVVKTMVRNAKGSFWGRFNSVARYDVGATTYALVSGGQYGIVVVDITSGYPQLADVIWVPTGAWAVRTIGKQWATAIDGDGRALLIDLTHIDERSLPKASPCPPPGTGCPLLFPSLAASLRSGSGTGQYTFGSDDPRITWRAETSGMNTTLAPVADPETGMVFNGTLLQSFLRVMSGIDPHVAVKVNLGKGTLSEVSSIVPLGVPLPKTIAADRDTRTPCTTSGADTTAPTPCKENISLGAFRVEMTLPGSVLGTLGGQLNLAIESERVPGALTEQTQKPLPAAHLRKNRPDSLQELNAHTVTMLRVLPPAIAAQYRLQKGFNLFISPWILALADPRASSKYDWGSNDREDAGCMTCTIPAFLNPATSNKQLDTDFFEIYTNGRYLTVRPDRVSAGGSSIFANSGNYAYLGDKNRVFARVGTVMADTVRPPKALVAANAPPVATGQVLDTIYLHSGEVESSSVDFDAGGRAGWNVVFDRVYRSRTIGETAFGFGWDSGIFKRLRALPTGDVEYRDGSGEVWLYHLGGSGYETPLGYTQKLIHTERGWTLIDQKRRVTFFDELGRVSLETDEFFTPDGKGNVIRYIYGDDGRLAAVIDPNDRKNEITYKLTDPAREGFVDQIKDWHQSQRVIKYTFDDKNRLTDVEMPQVATSNGTIAPKRTYGWSSAGGSLYNDQIELATNLETIKDPTENATGGNPRVKFGYGPTRDQVGTETWGANNEQATFQYPSPTQTVTLDVLGQRRIYDLQLPAPPAAGSKLDWYSQDRAHVRVLTEENVTVSTADYGKLPATRPVPAATPPATSTTRIFRYFPNTDGTLNHVSVDNGPTTTFGYHSIGTGFGQTLDTVTTSGGPAQPVARKINYRNSSSAMVDSIEADGQKVEQHEPDRSLFNPIDKNSIRTTATYDQTTGLLKTATTQCAGVTGCSSSSAGSTTTIDYPTSPVPNYKRGLPEKITDGTSGANQSLVTKFTYLDENTTQVTDPSGVQTTTTYDPWHRPVHLIVVGPAQQMQEDWEYDATGRVHIHKRKQGNDTVTTTLEYDSVGRQTSVTTDHVAANGNPNASIIVKDDYSQFANGRTITHTGAGGAITTVTLDALGRTTKTSTDPGLGQNPIVAVTAYDIAGNAVYRSDTDTTAVALAWDAAGRQTDAQLIDGTARKAEYDGFDHIHMLQKIDSAGHIYYTRTTSYQPDGQVQSSTVDGDHGTRAVSRLWDGGGRTMGLGANGADEPFAMQQSFDDASRIQSQKRGGGDPSSPTIDSFTESTFTGYGTSDLAPSIISTEKKAQTPPNYQKSLAGFDTLGKPQSVSLGSLTWTQSFDQAGHPISFSAPGRPAHTFSWDGRGAVTQQTLPDGSTQSHDYDSAGTPKLFTDPTSEQTQTTTDNLGRPLTVKFKDGSSQTVVYRGARIVASQDREGRWQSFVYENGHLTQVWDTQNGPNGNHADQLDQIDYDAAGRVKAWITPDARREYSDYTLDGRPQLTVQIRYKNGLGLQNPQPSDILDRYEQSHAYNGAGQRTTFSVPPGAGAAGFTSQVTQHFDPLGNLKSFNTDSGLLLNSNYRDVGRPIERKLSLPSTNGSPKLLTRSYDYLPNTGQLLEMRATIDDPATGANTLVAGSRVGYDGLQVNDAQLLGVSGGTRHTRYSYDTRSRVAGSVTAATSTTLPPSPGGQLAAAGSALETPDAADFRTSQTRQPLFDSATADQLKKLHFDVSGIDPPSITLTPANAGHKIATVTRGSVQRNIGYFGADLIDDGIFVYHYDRKGRLDWTAEQSGTVGATIRRVVYSLDGRGRIVGRTAQSAAVTSVPPQYGNLTWQTETRADVLAHDGLPAETTWIWDPVSDRPITVMRAGASFIPNDPNGNVLRQFIHGDMGYDDPLEVAAIDPTAPAVAGQPAKVMRLYPIFNEAAAGELQAVVNANGEVVARSVNNDPYGSAEFDLSGAAIDQVTVNAAKDNNGNVTSVTVKMRATEQLSASTVANGARLAIVDSSGTPLRTSSVAPALDPNDPFTIVWTIAGADWTAFTSNTPVTVGGTSHTPAALSIAATSTLRASVWTVDVPILAAPDWAIATKPVLSSSALPFEERESLNTVGAFVNGIANGQSGADIWYDIPSLSLIGRGATNPYIGSLFVSAFQAHPFAEPMNGKNYVRARWYDPTTGMWLTPDPLGYHDSADLYAYAGGDPINGRDPTGLADDQQQQPAFGIHEEITCSASTNNCTPTPQPYSTRGEYYEYLRANGADDELAKQMASQSGLPDTPLSPHAFQILTRSANLAAPAVNRMAGGLAFFGAAGQGFAAAESWNPTLASLALNNGYTSLKMIATGEAEPSPLGKGLQTFYARHMSPEQAANHAAAAELAVNIFAGFTPGFRGGSSTPVTDSITPPEETGLQLGTRVTLRLSMSDFTPEEIEMINRKYAMANMRLAGAEETGEIGANVDYSYYKSQRFVRDTLYPGEPVKSVRVPSGWNVDEMVSRQFGGRQVRPNQQFLPDALNQRLGLIEYGASRHLPPGTPVLGFEIEWRP